METFVQNELRITFRRTFSPEMVQRWHELVEVTSSIAFTNDPDVVIWQYDKSGKYSSKLFYAIINFRGVLPIFVPVVWKIEIPPKIQMFLWLQAHNRLMTVDNLLRRGIVKPRSCQFCKEDESIAHLFFECVVAKAMWEIASRFLEVPIGVNFENIATKWLDHKKYGIMNVISSNVLRAMSLMRNDFVFHKQVWKDNRTAIWWSLKLMRAWAPMYAEQGSEELGHWMRFLEREITRPLAILNG